MDNMNWDQMEKDAVSSISTTRFDGDQKNVFFKCKSGIHKLRILPTGNRLDNLPYMKIGQHVVRVPNTDGRIQPTFMLCGSFLWNNLISKPNNEEKKNNSLIGYLMKAGKMSNDDFKKFQDYGCPFCKAYAHMEMHGVTDEERSGLRLKEQYLWNVLWRKAQYSGDDNIYVLGMSKKHFNSIIATIRKDRTQNYFTLDPVNGFDVDWTATNEGIHRRYETPVFDRMPSPLNLGQDQIPYDLAEIAITQFKSYQEMLNLVKQGYGVRLKGLGFIAEGDIVLDQAYNVPNTPVPSLVSQTPEMMMAQQMPVNLPQPTQQRTELAGGYYQIGGMLYSPDGKAMF